MINSESRLLHSFFETAVTYDIEEFINRSAVEGFPVEMVNNEEPFIYSVQILLFHAPMLCTSEIYCGIENFLKSFIEYTDFLPCVTEVLYNRTIFATNRYHTIEEKNIQHMEDLRNNTVKRYNSLKLFQKN